MFCFIVLFMESDVISYQTVINKYQLTNHLKQSVNFSTVFVSATFPESPLWEFLLHHQHSKAHWPFLKKNRYFRKCHISNRNHKHSQLQFWCKLCSMTGLQPFTPWITILCHPSMSHSGKVIMSKIETLWSSEAELRVGPSLSIT